MGKRIDWQSKIGERKGKLTLNKIIHERSGIAVDANCDCGGYRQMTGQQWRTSGIVACKECSVANGFEKKYPKPPVGAKFGEWTVTGETEGKTYYGARTIVCECSCGQAEMPVSIPTLYAGKSRSCGCKRGYGSENYPAQSRPDTHHRTPGHEETDHED